MGDRMITRERSKRFVGYFNTVAKGWDLTGPEQMKLLRLSTLSDLALYISGKRNLTEDMLLRIDHLNGLYCALHSYFPGLHRANSWVRRPNKYGPCRGRSALFCMMENKVTPKHLRDYVRSQLV